MKRIGDYIKIERLRDFNFFRRPFSFNGRIGRIEYILTIFIAAVINDQTTKFIQPETLEYLIFSIPMIWFLLAQGSKRCHDIGYSGWIQAVPLILFWMIFEKGKTGSNKFGETPNTKPH